MSVYSKNKYDKHQPNDAWFKIFQYIQPNKRILDIGCSSGRLGAALKKEKNVYIVGLDIDKADVELAKKNLDEAHIANLETDDLSAYGKFDYVIMADVIEHLVDPVSALQKVKTLLKPGGKFVFSIPNMANVTTRLELLGGRFAYKEFGLLDKTHLHFYDTKEVDRVFKAAGLAVQEMNCTLRPIPDELLKTELDKLGIALTPKLKKLLNSQDAIIYQFIGVAKAGKPVTLKPESTTHLDVISEQIDEMRQGYDKEIAKKTTEIEGLSKEVNRLDTELSAILNSKSWKLVTKIQDAKHKLPIIRGRAK